MTQTDSTQPLRLLLAARLSRKTTKEDEGIGIETQDKRGREWAERQQTIDTVHGTYSGIVIIGVAADYKRGTVAPWDRPKLKPWVTKPEKMQQYDGILAYKNDRLSRGAWEDETRIRQWASQNGKVLVIVDGPQWPPRNDGDFWSWTAQAKQANGEWEEIRERSMRAQGELRARGKLVGRPPWGYTPIGEKYNRTIIPTDAGCEFIPQIFQRIADGDSLMTVAKWLDSQGAKPSNSQSWSPKSVAKIVRTRTYTGARLDANGQVEMTVEPLVDAKLWTRANNRLDNAPRGRRGPVTGKTALLTGSLFCGNCPKGGKLAPMYRIHPARMSFYYRCAGHHPQRKGCGTMVNLSWLDSTFDKSMSADRRHPVEWVLIEGTNHDIELAEVMLALDDLPKRKLPDSDEDAERRRLRDERNRLEELNRHAQHDRYEPREAEDTYADRWRIADYAGKRAIVKEMRIIFQWDDKHEPLVNIGPLWDESIAGA
jgi:DNA invertase Pin-like site-specific DNA recombinase